MTAKPATIPPKREHSRPTKRKPSRGSDSQKSAPAQQASESGLGSPKLDRFMSPKSMAKSLEENKYLMKPSSTRSKKISLKMSEDEPDDVSDNQDATGDEKQLPADDEEYTSSDIVDGDEDEDEDGDSDLSSSDESESENECATDDESSAAVDKALSEQQSLKSDESEEADDESEDVDEVATESREGGNMPADKDDESEVADEVAVDSDEESGEEPEAQSPYRRPADSMVYELTEPADDADDAMLEDARAARAYEPMPRSDSMAAVSDGEDIEGWSYDGLNTSMDLMVLDFMSARIIETAMRIFAAPPPRSSQDANAAKLQRQQFGFLAREHVQFRMHHFTQSLFLSNSDQPDNEPDVLRWIDSMKRVNLATFLLLVVEPQAAVEESVGDNVPDRRHVVQSHGMGAAALGFFENIVPSNRRNSTAFELLVELQTQQWVLGALNDARLQEIVGEQREVSDVFLAALLAVSEDSQGQEGSDVDQYRAILNQRLNKLSGSTLAGARTNFGQEVVRQQVVAFVQQCSDALPRPTLLSLEDLAQRAGMESSAESAAEESPVGESNMSNSIDGDFEVAIVKVAEEQDLASGSDAGMVPTWQLDHDAECGFLETRKVAMGIRQMSDDPHLDEVISRVEPIHIEPIDDGQLQSQQPKWSSSMLCELEQTRQKVNRTMPDPLPEMQRDLVGQGGQDQNQNHFGLGGDEDVDDIEDSDADGDNSEQNVSADQEPRYPLRNHQSQASRGRSSSPQANGRVLRKRSHPESPSGADMLETTTAGTVQQASKRSRVPDYRQLSHQIASSQFRGRRGIAAEDLSSVQEDLNPIGFTPSPRASPEPADSERPSDGSTESAVELAGDAPRAGVRQLRPLNLTKRGVVPPRQTRRTDHQAASESDSPSDSDSDNAAPQRGLKRSWGRKQSYRYWTEAEERCFEQAFSVFGRKWTRILKHHGKNGSVDRILQNRTTVNLKDKARDIRHKRLREGKPLGPFA
ncbi:TTAGGG repeat binding factor [Linderina macrospora]|uniref:TTAGGG repeat binding factor n=1 Tax=Linderina macrospora TaxID=4868 RepID=A0ACC1JES9_9FUNG|nr:TTAGGG repeat binding factor [Linderina macrospora]